MELKEFFEFFKRPAKNLAVFFICGLILGGTAFFALPKSFVSKGTLFVSRIPEESAEFYTYSGYYAQQTALSYADTVRGLLENEVLHAKALETLEIPVTDKNLRNLERKIRVKDGGPQLVGLEVKNNSSENAAKIWEALTLNIENTSKEINLQGDPQLKITRVKEKPVIQEGYRNLYVFSAVGGLMTWGLGVFFLALKDYLKEAQN
ncbi:hypothetical protein GF360_01390 [candidate division WWE3 bacterium]|nr:hypothetical protein [candidate division WWE3 bacterium]